MSRPRPLFLMIAVAGAMLALPALGQTWQWRDAGGRMVYSDLPPPPDVRQSQILRSPVAQPGGPESAAPPPQAAGRPAAAPAAAPRTWVEKEQESRKRAAEREESERKRNEERQQQARVARACEDARAALRTLESGMRAATLNARGEREPLDQAERARRIDSARKEIAQSCPKGG